MFCQLGAMHSRRSLVSCHHYRSSPAPVSALRQETAPPFAAERSNSASLCNQTCRGSGWQRMSGTLPDGGKGLSYTLRYAVVGANALSLP